MIHSIPGAVQLGLLYAFMSLGVYMTYRILDFPDLTVDGSFTTGGAVAAVMITHGQSPWVATACAFLAGCAAGSVTGLLHTKGKINALLSGILMMIALYSINLRISRVPNVPLINAETVFFGVEWKDWVLMIVAVLIVLVLLDMFFLTDLGLSLRATGDNPRMIRSFGAHTDNTKILGVALSNGLVALSGAFIAQQQGYSDQSMGIGMIVIGLAAVIIGEAIIGARSIIWATLAAVVGMILYRIIIAIALQIPWFQAQDLKVITAVIVIIALVVPTARRHWKQKIAARRRTAELAAAAGARRGGGQ
ncbi:ABC transporter permease [Cohnella caldifontis]|uniref:ABC transporter permease n=1 Tax=Cohnella caldifontis TaxID=3027471 RepID=UPI0023EDC637|nr:ABC transporter permease [Cohnella sp. YIM B05605]